MSGSAKLMTTFHVRQDNGCWGVMRGREESFGYFRTKMDAIQCALELARRHSACLVSIELAGRIEGELRFGPLHVVPA
jgi:hypothetical protein